MALMILALGAAGALLYTRRDADNISHGPAVHLRRREGRARAQTSGGACCSNCAWGRPCESEAA